MFIIDFDDTLFDTQAFKRALVDSVKELGVSEELFWQTYKEAYNSVPGKTAYNDLVHAEILGRRGFDKQAVLAAFQRTKMFLNKYLFPDAINLLEDLKTSGQKIILLSLGHEGFQKMKIEAAGLTKYFDEVYTTNDVKENIIKEILTRYPTEQVWFINDKIEETKKLINIFPQIIPILKVSPLFSLDEYKKSGILFFSTLNKIKEYAEQRA